MMHCYIYSNVFASTPEIILPFFITPLGAQPIPSVSVYHD